MGRDNRGRLAVIHGMDRRGVLLRIQFPLRLHGSLYALVVIHRNSLDPGHGFSLSKLNASRNQSLPPLAPLRSATFCALDAFFLLTGFGASSATETCSWIACRSVLSSGCFCRYGPVIACADSSALKRR